MDGIPSYDPYSWEYQFGWRKYRMLRPGRGMYYDVKRRLPYYWSDITDGFTYRGVAATIRIYFVNILPALAFQLDMSRRTGGFFGINEGLFSSALAAIVFSIFSCQPLTVVGITGLISLFNYTIYDIMALHDISIYPQVMAWVAIWAAITHWIISFGNLCDYMRYVTDFSSNTFGFYVGIIYVEKGVQELVSGFQEGTLAQGYLGVVIALCFTATVYGLETIGNTTFFKPVSRGLLADYAYPLATLFWTGFAHFPGPLRDTHIPTIPITRAFYPTQDRGWLIPFWELEAKWVFAALPMGILLTLLFYYDHNVSSITAQAKQFPLKKPAGFHWDFFLLGCTSFIAGIIGIPLPNGLVPQAPVHTDACTNYGEKLVVVHTDDDTEGTEIRKKVTFVESVVEQRISHFVMALAIIGTMTGPLLIVLHTIPRALFAGVFFIVGLGSILGGNVATKLVFLLSERRFISSTDGLLTLPRPRIILFLSFQIIAVAATVAISQTLGAIGFPVLITLLIPLRWVIMPHIFSVEELSILDALTADNPVVLASLGGKPTLPETKRQTRPRGSSAGAAGRGDVSEQRYTLRRLKDEEKQKAAGNGAPGSNDASGSSPNDTAVEDEEEDISRDDVPVVPSREENKEMKRQGRKSVDKQRVGNIHR